MTSGFARTTFEFHNPNARALEGNLEFPLLEGQPNSVPSEFDTAHQTLRCGGSRPTVGTRKVTMNSSATDCTPPLCLSPSVEDSAHTSLNKPLDDSPQSGTTDDWAYQWALEALEGLKRMGVDEAFRREIASRTR
jgi:hypothetical protein